jgi:hypothetical protein
VNLFPRCFKWTCLRKHPSRILGQTLETPPSFHLKLGALKNLYRVVKSTVIYKKVTTSFSLKPVLHFQVWSFQKCSFKTPINDNIVSKWTLFSQWKCMNVFFVLFAAFSTPKHWPVKRVPKWYSRESKLKKLKVIHVTFDKPFMNMALWQ